MAAAARRITVVALFSVTRSAAHLRPLRDVALAVDVEPASPALRTDIEDLSVFSVLETRRVLVPRSAVGALFAEAEVERTAVGPAEEREPTQWRDVLGSIRSAVADKADSLLPEALSNVTPGLLLTPVFLGFALLMLVATSAIDAARNKDVTDSELKGEEDLKAWSITGIVALTSYRFYTGFLSSTWMPYLLAMEGAALTQDRQSFFMGCAKLIYGMSIMLNPMFGLIGDKVAVVSRWSGRRLFVLAGVGTCGLGIYGCLVAAEIGSVPWYMVATVLWMLGEAMADVTTETLVPELLPRSQYQVSSSIRAMNFLVGGLSGYVALLMFKNTPYTWLYYAYLGVMFLCAFMTLSAIQMGDLEATTQLQSPRVHHDPDASFWHLVSQAYLVPASYQGGFPRACLAIFVFSLGSAPMFFLLLMVRDVLGVHGHTTIQTHFSLISMLFFVMAAVSSVLGARGGASASEVERSLESDAGISSSDVWPSTAAAREEASRWRFMVLSTVSFGVVCAVIPLVGLLPTLQQRLVAFYFVGAALGFSFGAVYARFQECTWNLIPPTAEIANAMGFCAMCKLLGVGLGNFFVGIILDRSAMVVGSHAHGRYHLSGYFLMCAFCTATVLTAAGLVQTIPRMMRQPHQGPK